MLDFLYGTKPGRLLLKPLVSRPVSGICGKLLDTRASKALIDPFIKKNEIDLSDYETGDSAAAGYDSFNDFFTRRVKTGARPVDMSPDALISPCDGLLTVYDIHEGLILPVKQSSYTIESLVRNRVIAEHFKEGTALVFRLCVDNYHRYCYIESGHKSRNVHIPGVLHTVRPVALLKEPVFIENSREYTVIDTENMGRVVQMEVGAMLVGKIVNYDGRGFVERGTEKGKFLYGGSTIIVLLERGRAELDESIMKASAAGEETPVRYGGRIGTILRDNYIINTTNC